jgi:hypothetical protein
MDTRPDLYTVLCAFDPKLGPESWSPEFRYVHTHTLRFAQAYYSATMAMAVEYVVSDEKVDVSSALYKYLVANGLTTSSKRVLKFPVLEVDVDTGDRERIAEIVGRIKARYIDNLADFSIWEFLGAQRFFNGALQTLVTAVPTVQEKLLLLMVAMGMIEIAAAPDAAAIPYVADAKSGDAYHAEALEICQCAIIPPAIVFQTLGATPASFNADIRGYDRPGAGGTSDYIAEGKYGCVLSYPPGRKDATLVIKRQNAEDGMNELIFETALRQSGAAAKNIARIVAVFWEIRPSNDDIVWTTMKYARGGSLADWIDKKKETKYSASSDLSAAIKSMCLQLLRGIIEVHTHGFVHGDLHAGNILLAEAVHGWTAPHLLIADFGFAHALSQPWVDYDALHTNSILRELVDLIPKPRREFDGVDGLLMPANKLTDFRNPENDRVFFQRDRGEAPNTTLERYEMAKTEMDVNALGEQIRGFVSESVPENAPIPRGMVSTLWEQTVLKAVTAVGTRLPATPMIPPPAPTSYVYRSPIAHDRFAYP